MYEYKPVTDSTINMINYGEYSFGQEVYSAEIDGIPSDFLPTSIVHFSCKVVNDSALYIEKYYTRDRTYFNKVELSWNYVKDAVAYAIFKGTSIDLLNQITLVKDNFWKDTRPSDGLSYYQIRPVFLPLSGDDLDAG